MVQSISLRDRIRAAAEQDLETFIKLVAPHRMIGAVHEEIISWWAREEAKTHQLLLLPRAHQKSSLIAYRVAWYITQNPEVTILYISATANLAEKQLKAIKDILTCSKYREYWPEMIHLEEGKREKWSAGEISIDHPKRKAEGVRDPTVFTAGLTTGITGLHCDVAVLDDVVVKENAYTEDGRTKVSDQYSLLSSIENPDALEWVVGTRYHPKDLYSRLMEMEEEIYDDEGIEIGTNPVYEVKEYVVEDAGDGTGEFIWPRQRRADGKWFGFDIKVLSKKRAQYLDKTQYRSQYYNDPNDPEGNGIDSSSFQYYDRKHVTQEIGYWYYKNNRLNVYASVDFAFSLSKKSDYTAIVVIGIDKLNNVYVLDIDRFKTDRISEYFNHILRLYNKWGFRRIRAEVTVGQKAIVKELKERYIKEQGIALTVDEYRPSRYEGAKEERIQATLEPRYDNGAIWHYKGGMCQILEEELILAHPPHDDVKDALASVVDIAVAPTRARRSTANSNVVQFNRFGGF